MAVGLFALMVALATTSGASDEPQDPSSGRAEVRIASGGEWDTNAKRSISKEGSSPDVVADGLMRLVIDASGELNLNADHWARIVYKLGAKRFFSQGTEDLLAHDLTLATSHQLLERIRAGVDATLQASRTRSGTRDYSLGLFGASLSFQLLDELVLEANGGYVLFGFPKEHRFDYRGPEVGAAVILRPTQTLMLEARGNFVVRRYDSNGQVAVTTVMNVEPMIVFCDAATELTTGLTCQLRRDRELQLSFNAIYRDQIVLGLLYLARLQRSSSDFENVDRHRITAFATVGLPLAITMSGVAALQFNIGASYTDNRNLAEDDENQNSVQLQLQRELFDGLLLEARYALFANRFATAPAAFTRHTVYLGVSYRIGLFEGDLGSEIGDGSRR